MCSAKSTTTWACSPWTCALPPPGCTHSAAPTGCGCLWRRQRCEPTAESLSSSWSATLSPASRRDTLRRASTAWWRLARANESGCPSSSAAAPTPSSTRGRRWRPPPRREELRIWPSSRRSPSGTCPASTRQEASSRAGFEAFANPNPSSPRCEHVARAARQRFRVVLGYSRLSTERCVEEVRGTLSESVRGDTCVCALM
mmetsp:Transcript_6330/g.21249  ORF Transcript_6330/g.21249 Transcript_6330/m.21249 type:complete len:200 (-) Transcript_6330:26-625(-)